MLLSSPITTSVGAPSVFEVLGFKANAGAGENAIAAAHPHPAIDHHMGADAAAGADRDLRANHGEGADVDAGTQFGLGINHGSGMDPRLEAGAIHGGGSGGGGG
jgi:hypothetical protein